jgi:hypothetical protein
MRSLKSYLAAQLVLLCLLVAAPLVRFLVRAPAGTSADQVFKDAVCVGRVHQVVIQIRDAVSRLGEAQEANNSQAVGVRRVEVEHAVAFAEQLRGDLAGAASQWVPVAEAADLVADCQRLARTALAGTAPPEDTKADPAGLQLDDREKATRAKTVLAARSNQLGDQAASLEARVAKAVTEASLARGTLLGFEAVDLLMSATVLACVVGIVMLRQARKRLTISPVQAEQLELELIGRTDPQTALARCHTRIRDLLAMADDFYHGKTS